MRTLPSNINKLDPNYYVFYIAILDWKCIEKVSKARRTPCMALVDQNMMISSIHITTLWPSCKSFGYRFQVLWKFQWLFVSKGKTPNRSKIWCLGTYCTPAHWITILKSNYHSCVFQGRETALSYRFFIGKALLLIASGYVATYYFMYNRGVSGFRCTSTDVIITCVIIYSLYFFVRENWNTCCSKELLHPAYFRNSKLTVKLPNLVSRFAKSQISCHTLISEWESY